MIERHLINRRYARLWLGQATSVLGDAVFDTTLVLWIATVLAVHRDPVSHRAVTAAWAPAAVAALATVIGVAVLLVGPLSGVFVDRWNKRSTMLRTEVLRLGVVGLLAVAAFWPVGTLPVGVWLGGIYAVVFVVNAAGQFFAQSRFVVIGEVVDRPVDRARAAGIGQATTGAMAIIGPPLAAPLLITVGLQWALVFNAVTYAVSYAMIRSVGLDAAAPAAPPEGRSLSREFREGLRWFRGTAVIKRLLYGFLITSFGAGALTALIVFFVADNLGLNPKLLGVVEMFLGIGAIAGALLAGPVVRLIGTRRTVWIPMVVAGALLLALARQTTFVGGAVFFLLVSLVAIMFNTALTPLLLAHTPKELLGRMMSVLMPALQVAQMASVVVSGWLASTVLRSFHTRLAGIAMGPYDTIYSVAALFLIGGGLYQMATLPRDDAVTATSPDPARSDPMAVPET